MSFDIKSASRVRKLTAEIDEIRATEAAQQRLADFSSWGIFPGRDGSSYRLEKIGASSGLFPALQYSFSICMIINISC